MDDDLTRGEIYIIQNMISTKIYVGSTLIKMRQNQENR